MPCARLGRTATGVDVVVVGVAPVIGALARVAQVSTRPTLFLTVGLPGVGKTVAARRIEQERGALRLTKDEWMKALFGTDNPESASDVIEGRLVEIGLRALELGCDVVIDFGLWGRDERSALRAAAADRDARVELVYLEVPPEEQRRRLDARLAAEPHTTWPMSDEDLARYAEIFQAPDADELHQAAPVPAPPAGFATWDEWRHDRWPPSRR